MWTRADELTQGMTTVGGLKVTAIDSGSGLIHITFSGYHSGKKEQRISYTPDHQFDMAHKGTNPGGTNMAQRVNIETLSDLSEKPDASTVTFGLDGVTYEIDLTEQEQEKLRDVLAKYVGAARPLKGGKAKARKAQSGPSPKDIRAWAADNGVEVPARGRIPEDVREQYVAANPA